MISLIFNWVLVWVYEKPVSLVQPMMGFITMCANRFNARKHMKMPVIENSKDPKFQGVRGYIRAANRLVRVLVVLTYQRAFFALLYAIGGVLLIILSFVVLIGAFAIWGFVAFAAYGFIWEIVEFWRWVISKI